jgi:DNA-binding beta-propeller fold protein YncE/mono/diheme cytochrome c family protein
MAMLRRVCLAGAIVAAIGCRTEPEGTAAPASASASTTSGVSAEAPPARPAAVVKNRAGSAIAITMTEDALLVASEDHRALFRVALPFATSSQVTRTSMPGAPAQIVALADKVLVTIRDPGLLLELGAGEGGALVEKRRVELAADAWGLAVTPDGATAVVTSAWTHTVSVVDVRAMRVKWSKEVDREPRGVVVLPDGERAYVSHLVGSALTRVDAIGTAEPAASKVALPPAPSRTPIAKELAAALGYALTTDPDGKRLFVPRHALGALGTWFNSSSWWGAGTVDVLRTANDEPLAPRKNGPDAVVRSNARHADTTLEHSEYTPDSSTDGMHAPLPAQSWDVVKQPRAVVYRARTHTLLVAGEGNSVVKELDARALEPAMHPLRRYVVSTDRKKPLVMPATGGAPNGIVLDATESKAYVFGRSTYDVSVVMLADDPRVAESVVHAEGSVDLAEDPLLEGVADTDPKRKLYETAVWGRLLYYMADDREMSAGMACAGCHPEGRDDGFTWRSYHEEPREVLLASTAVREATRIAKDAKKEPPGLPRQTPMLAGRLMAKGPYGWLAESETLEARVELGFHLHHGSGEAPSHALLVATFARLGLTPPPKVTRPLAPDEERGRDVFLRADVGCASCHDPASAYTDRRAVAVKLPDRPGHGSEDAVRFKTPSLLWVVGTAPYFHNGSVATLDDVVLGNDDRMGKTNQLSAADKAALIAYLKTL